MVFQVLQALSECCDLSCSSVITKWKVAVRLFLVINNITIYFYCYWHCHYHHKCYYCSGLFLWLTSFIFYFFIITVICLPRYILLLLLLLFLGKGWYGVFSFLGWRRVNNVLQGIYNTNACTTTATMTITINLKITSVLIIAAYYNSYTTNCIFITFVRMPLAIIGSLLLLPPHCYY